MSELTIEKLQENLRGTYDLADISDCQAVIRMLIRDLNLAHARGDKAEQDLKTLAFSVRHNQLRASELAEEIMERAKVPPSNMIDFLQRMSEEVIRAEELSDADLTGEVFEMVWGEMDVDSRESAVLSEMLSRFQKLTGQEVHEDEEADTE